MVHERRSGYGFNGYQVPSMPRGSRSARGKPLFKKKVDSETVCAFDLLATVAQELLQEKNSNPSSMAAAQPASPVDMNAGKMEPMDQIKHFKQEPCDQGSCAESSLSFQKQIPNGSEVNVLREHSLKGEGANSQYAYSILEGKRADKSGKAVHECFSGRSRNSFVSSTIQDHGIVKDEDLCISINGCSKPEEDGNLGDARMEDQGNGNVVRQLVSNSCCSEDQMTVDTKPPPLVSSHSCVQDVPFRGDQAPCTNSYVKSHNDNKVIRKDDDENSIGCTDPSTAARGSRKPPHVGDRRIRKFMASRFYNVSPKLLKNGELFNFDHVIKPLHRSRKLFSTRQRTKRFSTYKRKKFLDRCFSLTYERRNCSRGLTNFYGKTFKGEAPVFSAKRHGANESPSPLIGERSSYGSGNSHVKLRIQSFKVPELFVEIPETATVGLLKRTVLEAVTSILARGIRVGVLLQGEKVKDDNKTLLQSGISLDEKLDGLGFALEPGHTQISLPPVCKEDTHRSNEDNFQVVYRHGVIPPFDNATSVGSKEQSHANICQLGESTYALISSSSDIVFDKISQPPHALVAIPEMNVETLGVVPLQRKSRRPELAQRRTRRPFSVAEVEALVQAVENLGTGRWRDVKLRAFEDADHRTYVDLKDKWKTLVHTARISPQQRRGEPVPQELLDRVLAAHAYWSQLQAKQQVSQQGETCMLLSSLTDPNLQGSH